jgi:hypothetical protein
MNDFLGGAVAMAAAIVSLHYLKAWKQSKDELFRLFSIAFFLFMIERIVFQVAHVSNEKLPLIYCIRLLGFLAIVIGILQKNLKKSYIEPVK